MKELHTQIDHYMEEMRENFTLDWIRAGLVLHTKSAVEELIVNEDNISAHVQARVREQDQDKLFQVVLDAVFISLSTCSCQAGTYCEHMAATVLKLFENKGGQPEIWVRELQIASKGKQTNITRTDGRSNVMRTDGRTGRTRIDGQTRVNAEIAALAQDKPKFDRFGKLSNETGGETDDKYGGESGDEWRQKSLVQENKGELHLIEPETDGGVWQLCAKGERPYRLTETHLRTMIEICPELITAASTTESEFKVNLNEAEVWNFLQVIGPRLASAGVPVRWPEWWEKTKRMRPRLKAMLLPDQGCGGAKETTTTYADRESFLENREAEPLLEQFVTFEWRIIIGDLALTEPQFEHALLQERRLFYYKGRWIGFDPVYCQALQTQMKQLHNKGLRVKQVLAHHFSGKSAFASIEIELNETLSNILRKLQNPQLMPLLPLPRQFQGTLRPYQVEGMSWMLFLRKFGLGGCLADEMGLGKTAQWLAYLLHLKQAGALPQAALLICPTSVLGNWQQEIEKFAPSLRVHTHYGSEREREVEFLRQCAQADIVLTTYTTARQDASLLAKIVWSCLGLDEAQSIKNAETKQAKAIRNLRADHRIALTGTPLENRLTELWSIFDFLNPGYLGSRNHFIRYYAKPIEQADAQRRVEEVRRLIQPFLLRRTKADPKLELHLPHKYEQKLYVHLTEEQSALYEKISHGLFANIDHLPSMGRRGAVLATLTKLKQVCNDPGLITDTARITRRPDLHRSHKLDRLLEIVQAARTDGEKCLIFTQFVEMGHRLQQLLDLHMQEPSFFLHGGIARSRRDEMISQFQNNDASDIPSVFILSLRAGGTGLNLTAANHVIHFDRWWNPAVENQATDRAHRIGQKKEVQVHKLITKGTLEERIDEMLEQKSAWSRQIIGTEQQWITEMTTDQLKEVFALRKVHT